MRGVMPRARRIKHLQRTTVADAATESMVVVIEPTVYALDMAAGTRSATSASRDEPESAELL